MGADLAIVPVPVLTDNYVWLIHDEASGETAAVDPSVGPPVLEAAAERNWRITQVLNTHWHPDHTGGNQAIHEATAAPVTGPEEVRRVYQPDRVVGEGDSLRLGSFVAEVWAIPAHTAGHIAYYFAEAKAMFVGDTLFAMGCGRLFEGTAAQMHANLRRLADLPEDVRVYCGHEYTLANARFAVTVEPDNAALAERLRKVEAARGRGEVTLPTTIGEERATNPFLRAGSVEEFARLRALKDSFG
ncbi:MAG TPA: hydroxyacylglutathione hydrolase [Sphingomicrobium sp.]|nr:hydroxyacylglutathione hydrolase [Sphingomicrobium sp.]